MLILELRKYKLHNILNMGEGIGGIVWWKLEESLTYEYVGEQPLSEK